MRPFRALALFLAACASSPTAKKLDHLDVYHGVAVSDPYRWLEELDSPDTRSWIESQNRLTHAYLGRIPEREPIRRRLTELWNYEKYGIPFRKGGRTFYTKNNGLQNQSVLYVDQRELLDPNQLSSDGTTSLRSTAVSDDGKWIAYAVSKAGSDWQHWRVRNVETGKDLPDEIRWSKFSGASWSRNSRGFYYGRYDPPRLGEELKAANYFQKVYYHALGTPQTDDLLIYERPDQKTWSFGASVTEDGKYLTLSIRQGTEPKNMFFYKAGGGFIELIDRFEASYRFIGNDGHVFYFLTDHEAPMSRVIEIDVDSKRRRVLIPEAAEPLQSVSMFGDRFVARYLKDAYTQVKIFRLDGSLDRVVELPGIGTAAGFGGDRKDRETFYSFSTFTDPGAVYRFEVDSGKSSLVRRPEVKADLSKYETRQVFYTSKDGTRVPMFLTHRKGLELDGRRPTLLYGYGGFNSPATPDFSVSRLVWMEMGGVYAQACLRGGGEYGREWHKAGTKLRKQNVFDDFIAAAEWLVAHRYTRREKLAIEGRSNGGLLVGACMTQRPDLFGACLPGVGVMDMLRFHKFTIGWAWVSDYGSADNPDEFKALYAYSPYHNIRAGTAYPPTLITTADHDDRVFPAHSFKFAAAMQDAQSGSAPILIRIETDAGHGAGWPTSKLIAESTDKLAFLAHVLGVQP